MQCLRQMRLMYHRSNLCVPFDFIIELIFLTVCLINSFINQQPPKIEQKCQLK